MAGWLGRLGCWTPRLIGKGFSRTAGWGGRSFPAQRLAQTGAECRQGLQPDIFGQDLALHSVKKYVKASGRTNPVSHMLVANQTSKLKLYTEYIMVVKQVAVGGLLAYSVNFCSL